MGLVLSTASYRTLSPLQSSRKQHGGCDAKMTPGTVQLEVD